MSHVVAAVAAAVAVATSLMLTGVHPDTTTVD